MQVISFQAPFRRRRLIKQALKDTPRNPHDALILADPDAELDGRSLGIPRRIRGKAEEHAMTPFGGDELDVPVMFSQNAMESKNAVSWVVSEFEIRNMPFELADTSGIT